MHLLSVRSIKAQRILIPLLLALCLGSVSAAAGDLAWRERGWGGGGRFTAVAVDPFDPSVVYAGSDVAGLYVSKDKGLSFTLRGAELDGFAVSCVAPDPETRSRVLVLTDAGLYLSKDQGMTLSRISAKVRYRARFSGSGLIVRHAGAWHVGTDIDGVFRMEEAPDGSWKEKPLFGLQGKKVNSLAVFKGRLHAATDEGVYAHDGEIWKHASDGLSATRRNIVDMAAHPSGKLYAVERETGLYSSDDPSRGWVRRGPSPASLPSHTGPRSFKAVAVSPVNPNLVYLGTDPTGWPHLLLRSQDGGIGWTLVKRFSLTGPHENWAKDLESVEQLAFAPDGREAYLADWWNLWRSVDEGASWLQTHQGLQNTVVNDIQVRPGDPAVMYAAADDNGLMATTDGGRSWHRRSRGLPDGHAAAVRISPRNPDRVYLLMNPWDTQDSGSEKNFHLFRSEDAGETWTSLRFKDKARKLDKSWADGRSTNLAIDPADDGVVYVGNNGYGVYRVEAPGRSSGPEQSVNARNVSASLPTPYVKGAGAVQPDPRDRAVLVVATQEGGIFRTEDSGATWKLTGGAKTFVFGMARDPGNPDMLYAAASDKRVLKSSDAGRTWQWLTLPGERPPHVAASAVAVLPGAPGAPGVLVVGTMGYDHKAGDGVFLSHDGGATFVRAPRTLPRAGVLALTPSREPGGLVLAGFNGLGLFELVQANAGDGR